MQQPCISEIKLRAFYKPFADILMIRNKSSNKEEIFDEFNIIVYCVVADTKS